MPGKTWTVITRDRDGCWQDESDAIHSQLDATDEATKRAAKSVDGTFEVVCHEIVATYMRSYEAIKL